MHTYIDRVGRRFAERIRRLSRMPNLEPYRRLLAALLLAACTLAAAAQAGAPTGPSGDDDRALTDRGLANLTALTRLAGVVRWFHPSDESAAADWPRVLIDAVPRVEAAADDDELLRRLDEVFRPLVPTLRLAPANAPPPADLPAPAGADGRWIAWRHRGLGGMPRLEPTFRSERVVFPAAEPARCVLGQRTLAAVLAGGRARLRAAVELPTDGGVAEAELRWSVLPDGGPPLPSGQPAYGEPIPLGSVVAVAGGGWRTVELEAEIPADVVALDVELAIVGTGAVRFDGVELERLPADGEALPLTRRLLADPGFEAGPPGLAPLGWTATAGSLAWLCAAVVGEDDPFAERRAVRVELRSAAVEPAAPHRVDLVPGLAAWVPTALPVDDEGHTLPRATPGAERTAEPSAEVPEGDGRANRLATVSIAWSLLQDFYPYFDLTDPTGERWAAALPEALRRAATDAGADALYDTLGWLVAQLDDSHGGVYRPDRRRLPLTWGWIGDRLVVTTVDADTPLAGELAPGDVVVALDGIPAAAARRLAADRVAAATPQWRTLRALEEMAVRRDGEQVVLDIDRGGEHHVVRATASARPMPAAYLPSESRPPAVAEPADGIVYVDLTRVTPDEFAAALPRLAVARGVVLDHRGYPGPLGNAWVGHLTGEAVAAPRMRTPIHRLPDRRGVDWAFAGWAIKPADPWFGGRVAVLIDGRAISQAETYLSMVEAYDLATLFGGPTAGTNGNVRPTMLPGPNSIAWTGLRVDKHDGSPHHGVGILPDVPVERTQAGVAAGRDEVLEAAIEWLRR